MTEAEWLACDDPVKVMEGLCIQASARKARLYLCGGCRQISGLFFRPESLCAVEVAERFADGLASEEELRQADWDAEVPTFGYELRAGYFQPDAPYRTMVLPRLREIGVTILSLGGGDWEVESGWRDRLLAAAELAEGTCLGLAGERLVPFIGRVEWPGRWLADCIGGDLFRRAAVRLHSLTPSVNELAQAAHERRALPSGHLDSARLAVLSDALEEAGCTDVDILTHLRSPGPHVRGCWALDLVLGKE